MDIYNWILSDEIREYLRANHRFSLEEKVMVIHTAYRSLEEKYAALQALSEEAGSREEQDIISQMCRVYDWVFAQLHQELPGQVFIYGDEKERDAGNGRSAYLVEGIFRTYEELREFAEDENDWGYGLEGKIDTVTANGHPDEIYDPDDILKLARIEKWACVDGKMERILSLGLFRIQRHCCLRDFLVEEQGKTFEEFALQAGISECVIRLLDPGDTYGVPPLPFQIGDLVCLDLPGCRCKGPLYGVLYVGKDCICRDCGVWEDCKDCDEGPCIDMYHVNMYGALKDISMSGWNIDFIPNLPVIHWLRRGEPAEVPAGQEPLLELCSGLHRLAERDRKAAESIWMDEACLQDTLDKIDALLRGETWEEP